MLRQRRHMVTEEGRRCAQGPLGYSTVGADKCIDIWLQLLGDFRAETFASLILSNGIWWGRHGSVLDDTTPLPSLPSTSIFVQDSIIHALRCRNAVDLLKSFWLLSQLESRTSPSHSRHCLIWWLAEYGGQTLPPALGEPSDGPSESWIYGLAN